MMTNPFGLLTVDRLLKVIAVDRFFLDGVGTPVREPEGHPLSEVLGKTRGSDPLEALTDRQNQSGSLETERRDASGTKRTLRVSYARAKLENDESAIFLTVEALPPEQTAKPKCATRRRRHSRKG